MKIIKYHKEARLEAIKQVAKKAVACLIPCLWAQNEDEGAYVGMVTAEQFHKE